MVQSSSVPRSRILLASFYLVPTYQPLDMTISMFWFTLSFAFLFDIYFFLIFSLFLHKQLNTLKLLLQLSFSLNNKSWELLHISSGIRIREL